MPRYISGAKRVDEPESEPALRALPDPIAKARNAPKKAGLGTPLGSLSIPDPNDGQTLIGDPRGDRWLEIGGLAMIIGMSGIGKSALLLQMLVLWSLGRSAFGIKPARPLRSVLVQVENSSGELAMTREGIFDGLKLTAEERETAKSNIIVHRECDDYGLDLVSLKLRPLCERWKPDLIALDPLTQLYGENMNDNQQAATWMTRGLQALALEHSCGIIINHHTNKPQKDDGSSSFIEGRYAGAGAAAFTNVPRANLVIRDIGEPDIFKLSAEKRGNCIGWKDACGAPSRFKYIAHSNETREDGSRVIFWREPSDAEISEIEAGRKTPERSAPRGAYRLKTKKEAYAEQAFELLKFGPPMSHGEWREAIMERGIPKSGANAAIKDLRDAGRVGNPNGFYEVVPAVENG